MRLERLYWKLDRDRLDQAAGIRTAESLEHCYFEGWKLYSTHIVDVAVLVGKLIALVVAVDTGRRFAFGVYWH